MTNSLRTRIAAVDEQHSQLIATLMDGWKCSCGVKFAKALQMVVMREWRLHKADAVIESLDLGIPCATTGCRMRQIARRGATGSGASSPPGTD